MKIYCDGSGWNGKKSEYCCVSEDGKVQRERYTAHFTNNEMEYLAVIKALETCPKGSLILTDSLLVVSQVTGKWKVKKEHLLTLCLEARMKLKLAESQIEWVPREKNLAGNLLESERGRD